MKLGRLQVIEDPRDPLMTYTKIVEQQQAATDAQENPWAGHLTPVSFEEGYLAAARLANADFTLVHSTMLTVPGRLYKNGLAEMTEEEFLRMCPVSILGTFLSRSDTLEVVGHSSLRQTTVEPLACFERFWDLCTENNFRVEAAGLIYNGLVLALFARHATDVVEIKGNRFIRYAYFLSAYGAGFAPMLVHAAYHPASGKLLLVDVQNIGLRRVRGLQIARKRVAGVHVTLQEFSMRQWDSDWANYVTILEQLSETYVPPMVAAKILTFSLSRVAKTTVRFKLAKNVRANMERFATYKVAVERRLREFRESFISATEGTANTALGAFLFGVFCEQKNDSTKQTSASFAIELSASGLTRKRAVYDAARGVLCGD